jgi:YtkA-like protein
MRSGCALLAILFVSCSRQPTEFKPIQQQRSGDYTVTLLNETGALKLHSDHLRVEIRNASTNELANVSNVQIQASMVMPGMGPMFGTLSTPKQTAPGQYDLDADFGMAGQWNLVVTFDPNGHAQFGVRAQ